MGHVNTMKVKKAKKTANQVQARSGYDLSRACQAGVDAKHFQEAHKAKS
jgi:hypothetical protein